MLYHVLTRQPHEDDAWYFHTMYQGFLRFDWHHHFCSFPSVPFLLLLHHHRRRRYHHRHCHCPNTRPCHSRDRPRHPNHLGNMVYMDLYDHHSDCRAGRRL